MRVQRPAFGLLLMLASAMLGTPTTAQTPLGSVFTFQGELRQSGNPAEGTADLRFRLYDAFTGGLQIGSQMDQLAVPVAQGRFTIPLDFGAGAFGTNARWLEIEARIPAGIGSYTLLTPRQFVSPAPVSLFALNAAAAANATQLNGQGPSFYQNAANLSSGTLPSARLSGTYSGALSLTNPGNTVAGSGAGLVGLNASNLSTGTLADARLSANIPRLNTANAFGNFSNTFAGNVGIGTTSPVAKLQVVGGILARGGAPGVLGANNNGYAFAGNNGDNDSGMFSTADGQLQFYTNADERVRITGSGTVGIGTATPAGKVHVAFPGAHGWGGAWGEGAAVFGGQGPLSGALGISYNDTTGAELGAIIPGVAWKDIKFYSNELIFGTSGGEERLRVTAAGRVGIGTPNPSAQLHVLNDYPGPSRTFQASWSGPAGSGSTFAGRFENTGDGGYAVYGLNSAQTGSTTGVYGQSNSPAGRGVWGSGAGGGIGVWGYSIGAGSYGGYFSSSGGTPLYVEGITSTTVLEVRGGADLAEHFDTDNEPEPVEPGMVVMLDAAKPGAVVISRGAYNKLVAGIVSGANDLSPGMILGKFSADGSSAPVALSGRVWTWVDAADAGVCVGDLLTTAEVPGHAMPVRDYERARGCIIGKAMSPLAKGERGLVLVLVTLQ